jgi:iron-sulfur cluster assembly protein
MITLTETAAEKLGGIMEQKGMKDSHALRVFVKGGGCGGMQYGMTFDTARDGDEVYEQHGMKVLVDPTSIFYIEGASIDYIENPNATSSCGCGSSFRTSKSHNGEEMPESCGHH